jgi:hypothetical protein
MEEMVVETRAEVTAAAMEALAPIPDPTQDQTAAMPMAAAAAAVMTRAPKVEATVLLS